LRKEFHGVKGKFRSEKEENGIGRGGKKEEKRYKPKRNAGALMCGRGESKEGRKKANQWRVKQKKR